jgi:hypothetical protein
MAAGCKLATDIANAMVCSKESKILLADTGLALRFLVRAGEGVTYRIV